MKKILVFLFLITSFAAFSDQISEEVIAEGVGAIVNDMAKTRDEAVWDAQRKAVEKGVGLFLSSDTLVQNARLIEDNIYTQTNGYVESYVILKEKKDDGLYFVTIKAIVKTSEIGNKLLLMGLIKKIGDPRIMVMVPEYNAGQMTQSQTAETEIIKQLVDAGYRVVDQKQIESIRNTERASKIAQGDMRTAEELANQYGADIIISGKVDGKAQNVILNDKDTGMISFTGNIEIRAIKIDNAEIILSENQELRKPGISAEQSMKIAASEGAKKIIDKGLLNNIAKSLLQKPTIQIIAVDITNDQYTALVKALKEQRTIKKVFPREMSGTAGRIDIDYDRPMEKLQELIEGIKEVPLTVKSSSRSKIEIKIIKPFRIDVQGMDYSSFKELVTVISKSAGKNEKVIISSKKYSTKKSKIEFVYTGDFSNLIDRLSEKYEIVDMSDNTATISK